MNVVAEEPLCEDEASARLESSQRYIKPFDGTHGSHQPDLQSIDPGSPLALSDDPLTVEGGLADFGSQTEKPSKTNGIIEGVDTNSLAEYLDLKSQSDSRELFSPGNSKTENPCLKSKGTFKDLIICTDGEKNESLPILNELDARKFFHFKSK